MKHEGGHKKQNRSKGGETGEKQHSLYPVGVDGALLLYTGIPSLSSCLFLPCS